MKGSAFYTNDGARHGTITTDSGNVTVGQRPIHPVRPGSDGALPASVQLRIKRDREDTQRGLVDMKLSFNAEAERSRVIAQKLDQNLSLLEQGRFGALE